MIDLERPAAFGEHAADFDIAVEKTCTTSGRAIKTGAAKTDNTITATLARTFGIAAAAYQTGAAVSAVASSARGDHRRAASTDGAEAASHQ